MVQASPLMLIRQGELQPLTMSIQLQYNNQLELKPQVTQYLKVDRNSYARFRIENKRVHGMVIRGYVFQNYQEAAGKLNEYPILYYPLKKIEQHYVDRKSDPDYIELVEVLEKATELLRLNHPEANQFGQQALERGQTALEHIFINDNVIGTLVDQLSQDILI